MIDNAIFDELIEVIKKAQDEKIEALHIGDLLQAYVAYRMLVVSRIPIQTDAFPSPWKFDDTGSPPTVLAR